MHQFFSKCIYLFAGLKFFLTFFDNEFICLLRWTKTRAGDTNTDTTQTTGRSNLDICHPNKKIHCKKSLDGGGGDTNTDTTQTTGWSNLDIVVTPPDITATLVCKGASMGEGGGRGEGAQTHG